MAVIVQDDTGLIANANSYVSVADFRAYHDARANKYLDDDDTIAPALIKASTYVDGRFRYKGRRSNGREQTQEWPRVSCYDRDRYPVQGIPQEVKDAVCEYALRAMSGDLVTDPTRDETGNHIASETLTVGPITTKTDYGDAPSFTMPRYPAADMALKRGGFVLTGGDLLLG